MSRKRYPLRVPRTASGIRSQESRAGSGRSWWFRRWGETLEAMGLGARLGRGRNYAMSGQVTALDFVRETGRPPRLVAEVVGSRPDPYEVRVDFRAPGPAARARIVAALRAEPMLVARLLADDLPTEVESVFRREGCALFPGGRLPPDEAEREGRRYDMVTGCSCPDYANPCKHAAAVLLLLGEEVARRPATLLELRGIPVEELCDED